MPSVHDSIPRPMKQLRRESLGRRHEESKSLRSTSIITKSAELNTKQDIFSELALADRPHTGDITSQKDPNVVEAAKHLYHKLLRKANGDLERVPPLPCESSPAEVRGQTTMSSPRDTEEEIVPST